MLRPKAFFPRGPMGERWDASWNALSGYRSTGGPGSCALKGEEGIGQRRSSWTGPFPLGRRDPSNPRRGEGRFDKAYWVLLVFFLALVGRGVNGKVHTFPTRQTAGGLVWHFRPQPKVRKAVKTQPSLQEKGIYGFFR